MSNWDDNDGIRRALRQAWELDDVVKTEQLIRNLARRLEQEAPGVSETILEGIDEILTVVRLKLPIQLRRSLACTNIIENMMGTIRRVCRNVKHWRNAAMALRWTGAASTGIADNENARRCARSIAGWQPLPAQPEQLRHPANRRPPVAGLAD